MKQKDVIIKSVVEPKVNPEDEASIEPKLKAKQSVNNGLYAYYQRKFIDTASAPRSSNESQQTLSIGENKKFYQEFSEKSK